MSRLAQVAAWIMLGLAGGLAAQEVPAGPQGLSPRPLNVKPPPVPKARVTGRVLCGDTRQPARGATILLEPLASQGAANARGKNVMGRVGLDGQYAIEHVTPGTYAVLGFLPGYLSPFDDLRIDLSSDAQNGAEAELQKRLKAGNTVHVGEDGTATADLVLERGASVSGRVQYADGSPAMQVLLEVQKEEASTEEPGSDVGSVMRGLLTHQSNSTDDRGLFRVSGIKPGRYRIAAVQPMQFDGDAWDAGMAFLMSLGDPRALHYFSGDTLHRKSAKVYELRAGDELSGVEIRLPIDGFHRVRGTLTDKTGQPVGLALLTLTDGSDAAVKFYAKLEPDGSFGFKEVPPGTYTLGAENGEQRSGGPGPARRFQTGSVAVIVLDKDRDGVVLALAEDTSPPKPPLPEEEE